MSTLQDTPDLHGRDHETPTAPPLASPTSLKLARSLSSGPHDPRARVAGEPRGAGLTDNHSCDERSCGLRGGGAWSLFGLALAIGLTGVLLLRFRSSGSAR